MQIGTRLDHIRAFMERRSGRQLVFEYCTPTGEERMGNLEEMTADNGEFLRVLSGNRLSDLDGLIKYEMGRITVNQEGFSELREIPLLRPEKGAAYGRTDPRQYHHDPEERADHCCGVIFQSQQHRNIPRQAAQTGACRQYAFIRV